MVNDLKYLAALLTIAVAALLYYFMSPSSSDLTPDWAGEPICLENKYAVVIVVPKIGRVTSYHRKDEENWFAPSLTKQIPADRPWPSYPGDKLWPTAQFLWPQSNGTNGADPVFDKLPWRVLRADPLAVTLESAISPGLGLQVVRTIRLDADSARVTQTYTLERVSRSAFPVCVWTVSTCTIADYVLMENNHRVSRMSGHSYHTFGNPEYPLANVTQLDQGHYVQFGWPDAGAQKAGTYGTWIALVRQDSAFVQRIAYEQDGVYLEESNIQAWVGVESNWCEIETSSPYWSLRQGEKMTWQVLWDLVDFPATTVEAPRRAQYLQNLGKPPAESNRVEL